MAGDREKATELLQDVFVRVWERLDSFRGDAAFTSWLHRLTVNVVLEKERADKRRISRVGAPWDELEGDGPGDEGRAVGGVGERLDLERAVAELPPGARRVFVLHDVEGYKHEEIARLMGLAAGTVRAQLHRARKLLMEALDR
jgi:RNA polymerase sigma-70 factor (ECF subfamily)